MPPQIRITLAHAPCHKHKRIARKSGLVSRYNTPELVAALRAIWMASDQLCSKRLKAALPLWLPHYEAALPLPGEDHTLLQSISAATIERLLKPARAEVKRKDLSGTKLGTLLKKHIPIQAGSWNVRLSAQAKTAQPIPASRTDSV